MTLFTTASQRSALRITGAAADGELSSRETRLFGPFEVDAY
jgi:hypothetical protein